MKNIYFIAFLMCLTFISKAQNSDPLGGHYMSLSNSYSFDLPMFDLSLKLPKNAGFRVPYWEENDAFLDIHEHNVTYSYSSKEFLKKRAYFSYSLPGKDVEDIALFVERATPSKIKQLDNISQQSYFLSKHTSIITPLGTYECAELSYNKGRKGINYTLVKDTLIISFIVFAKESNEIKVCEQIIKSLKKIDLETKRAQYAQQKALNEFDKQQPEIEKFTDLPDTTRSLTTCSFPELGFAIDFPENWTYMVRATPNRIIKKTGLTQVNWSKDDVAQQHFLMLYGNNQNSFIHMRVMRKLNEDKASMEQIATTQKVITHFPLSIDGIEADVTASGLEESPSLYFSFILKSCMVQFAFLDVTNDNIKDVQAMIESIRLSSDEKKLLTAASPNTGSLLQQLKIKNAKPLELPVFPLTYNEKADSLPKIPVTFKDAGISLKLASTGNIYASPKEYIVVNNKSKVIMQGKPDMVKGNISVTNSTDKEMITVCISSFTTKTTLEDFAERMVKNWKTYDMIKTKRAGYYIVNDKKWFLLEYTQLGSPVYMLTTFHNDTIVYVTLSGNSEAFKTATENMLYTFQFK